MKNLLREFVRRTITEVDVLSPDKDPRMIGTKAAADAASKSVKSTSLSSAPKLPTGQPAPLVNDKKHGPSQAYQSKENTRSQVQKIIAQKVKGGGIANDDDLARYLSDKKRIKDDGELDDSVADQDLDLALTALKMVPISVWKQLQ